MKMTSFLLLIILILIGYIAFQNLYPKKPIIYLDTLIVKDTVLVERVKKVFVKTQKKEIDTVMVDSLLNKVNDKDSLIYELSSEFSISDSTKDFNLYINAMPINKQIQYDLNIKPIIIEKKIEVPKEIIEKKFSLTEYLIGFILGILTWEFVR